MKPTCLYQLPSTQGCRSWLWSFTTSAMPHQNLGVTKTPPQLSYVHHYLQSRFVTKVYAKLTLISMIRSSLNDDKTDYGIPDKYRYDTIRSSVWERWISASSQSSIYCFHQPSPSSNLKALVWSKSSSSRTSHTLLVLAQGRGVFFKLYSCRLGIRLGEENHDRARLQFSWRLWKRT